MDEVQDQQLRCASQKGEEITLTEEQMVTQANRNIQLRQKMAKLFQQYKSKRTEAIFKKYQVRVTSYPCAVKEKIVVNVTGKKKVVPVSVENAGVKRVYFTFQNFDFVNNVFTVRDCNGNIIKTIKDHPLRPGESYRMKINFSSDHPGLYEQLLVFKFERGHERSETFNIMRLVEVICRTPQCPSVRDSQAASEIAKMFQPAKRKPRIGCEILLLPVVRLGNYLIPSNIAKTEELDMELEEKPLNWTNYSWRFHLLLHLEEYEITTALEKCNRDEVLLVTHQIEKDMLVLRAEDVLNKSHFDLSGCKALVTPLNQQGENIFYKGWIDEMDEEQIYLKFDDMTPMLENNPEQRKAIQHILARSAKPAPYLIFGPPGTGKTVTLVEVIKQIVKTQDVNILVCAPTNSTADHVCEKILEENIVPDEVFRLYSLSYKVEKIPQSMKTHCRIDTERNTLVIPTKEDLMKYRIMVTTLLSAGRLVTGGVPPGHYSYIIVDEAGQAVETECLVPIAGLLKPERGQVVLAGDPKQLGPIIVSKIADGNGLGMSLLERLMTEISLYQPHKTNGFNNRFITKLRRNYRSHPAILKISNELFYDGELQSCVRLGNSLYSNWELLSRKDFPLLFHGVAGIKEHDLNSPSVYNIAEVDVLKEYLKSLISYRHKNGLKKIEPKEIGIVAPYKKQVEKIKMALHTDKDLIKLDLENVLVGTVEIFQGKEYDVILVSTVRSNPRLTTHKQSFSLGFVKSEKRFNVAMTRAKNLLVVVGDPRVLVMDRVWNKFIHYCSKEGAYRGIILSDLEEEIKVAGPSPSPCPQQEVTPPAPFS